MSIYLAPYVGFTGNSRLGRKRGISEGASKIPNGLVSVNYTSTTVLLQEIDLLHHKSYMLNILNLQDPSSWLICEISQPVSQELSRVMVATAHLDTFTAV